MINWIPLTERLPEVGQKVLVYSPKPWDYLEQERIVEQGAERKITDCLDIDWLEVVLAPRWPDSFAANNGRITHWAALEDLNIPNTP